MKKMISMILLIAICVCSVCALADATIDTIMNAKTTQAFTEEPVSDADLNTILEAGLSATSAINQQPWFFAVITDQDIMAEISGTGFGGGAPAGADAFKAPKGVEIPERPEDMPENEDVEGFVPPQSGMPNGVPDGGNGSAKAALGDSPIAIIVYLDESGMGVSAFDTGLACQNMFIAANALGYGAKIVSSPTMALNGEKHDEICEKLGVDAAYTAVAVLLIGVPDEQVDGVSGATLRSSINEKVSFN